MRRSGAADSASSRRTQRAASASAVGRSNRSVLYSRTPRSPSLAASVRSCRANVRSTLAVEVPTSYGAVEAPGSRRVCDTPDSAVLLSASATWKSGCRARERSGASSSTSRSNGTSWWAYAARSVSRTRAISSAKVGSPEVSVRSTSVLTNSPTTSVDGVVGAARDRRAHR
ncbi:hypothetical protein SGRIM128S_08646 [Streptomyces griseomycini]